MFSYNGPCGKVMQPQQPHCNVVHGLTSLLRSTHYARSETTAGAKTRRVLRARGTADGVRCLRLQRIAKAAARSWYEMASFDVGTLHECFGLASRQVRGRTESVVDGGGREERPWRWQRIRRRYHQSLVVTTRAQLVHRRRLVLDDGVQLVWVDVVVDADVSWWCGS